MAVIFKVIHYRNSIQRAHCSRPRLLCQY